MTYPRSQESYPSPSRKQTTNSNTHLSRTFRILHSSSLHSHLLKQVLASLSDSPSLPLSPSMAQCSLCSIAWAPSTLPPPGSSVVLLTRCSRHCPVIFWIWHCLRLLFVQNSLLLWFQWHHLLLFFLIAFWTSFSKERPTPSQWP